MSRSVARLALKSWRSLGCLHASLSIQDAGELRVSQHTQIQSFLMTLYLIKS